MGKELERKKRGALFSLTATAPSGGRLEFLFFFVFLFFYFYFYLFIFFFRFSVHRFIAGFCARPWVRTGEFR